MGTCWDLPKEDVVFRLFGQLNVKHEYQVKSYYSFNLICFHTRSHGVAQIGNQFPR